MNCHSVFNCVGHNHELTNNRLIKETVLKYVNEAEFKELFTIAALEKIETVTSSAIAATSSAIKASLDARNAVNDLTVQTIDFVNDAINNTAIEGGVLADTFVVVDGSLSQRTVNRGVESIADLSTIKNPKDGLRVYVKSYHAGLGKGGGYFIYDSTKTATNDSVVNFNGWIRQYEAPLTLDMAGAYSNLPQDSSDAINVATLYATTNKMSLSGKGKTYSAIDIIMHSNLDFRDALIRCSVFDKDEVAIIKTVKSTSWDTPTTNVYLENIHLDGLRHLHTNVGMAGDGARSGFAIFNVCDDITFEKCTANNFVTDGFGFFPNGISFGTRNNMLNNVKLIDCEAHWNGRHGGSSDSENGLHFIRGKYQNNGKSLIEGAPYDTGNSGRLLEGPGTRMYGAGWDFETYTAETNIRNVILENVDMRYNSASSATFYRVHDPVKGVNNNIRIEGGKFDSAVPERAAIEFTTFNSESPITHTLFDGVVIDGADMGGRSLVLSHTNAKVSNLINYSRLEVGGISNITLDKAYDNITNYNPETTKLDILSTKTKEVVLGKSNSDTAVKLHLSGSYDSKSIIDVMVGEDDKRGGIGFHISDIGGINTYFYNRNTAHTAITQEGSILPQVDNVASIGNGGNRFKDIYVASGVIATSDARYKEDVNSLTTKELLIAQSLKGLIKSYKFKGSTRTHIGVLAQEVESAFTAQGLDAFDYGLLCLDKWDASDAVTDEDGVEIIPEVKAGYRYAIRYDELIMFILAAI